MCHTVALLRSEANNSQVKTFQEQGEDRVTQPRKEQLIKDKD